MIKTVIKRNGSAEDFSASKINGWSEWASKSLGGLVDWSSVVIEAVSQCPETCSTIDLQKKLIDVCVSRRSWEYNRMAGRLYASLIKRELYGDEYPTVQELHSTMFNDGLMVKLNYSVEEYKQINKIIDHTMDLKYPHYQLNQIRYKYALRNKVSKQEYESAQFTFMRMAMALAENEKTDKLLHVQKYYEHFSYSRLNAPTLNYTNLGTVLNGYASCCLYTTDDSAKSLATGDHIAYMMTCNSAGIGTHIKTRSIGEPVRAGMIPHQGKLPYYRAMVGAVQANLQNGRGGASTVHYTAYDPEVEVIQKLRHPLTPEAKRISGCHYSFGSNKFFARKVAKNEEYAPFSYLSNPELYEAQYIADSTAFEDLYSKHEQTATKKLNAREIVVSALTQAYDTGVQYLHFTDTINKHTPFKEKIYSSNLCQEVMLPTKPFKDVQDLYSDESEGEIGLCSLAGIVVSNIESDEQYAEVAYYALKMIDTCIHKSDYPFKSLEKTAKARMSAGVGIIGLAHLMAKKGKQYSDIEGLNFIHELSETHAWHLINASLKLGKELGNAPWISKTKWPDGWLPIDTANKNIDRFTTVGYKRDWGQLRSEIIANKGIRNSVLIAHMPSESSSISMGTTNGVYPIRELNLMKTNDTLTNHWSAPDGTKLAAKYQQAWDTSSSDLIKCYAVIQKFTDNGISADLYVRLEGSQKVSSTQIIQDYLDMVKFEMKSRYYVNSKTSSGLNLGDEPELCESCTL